MRRLLGTVWAYWSDANVALAMVSLGLWQSSWILLAISCWATTTPILVNLLFCITAVATTLPIVREIFHGL